MAGLIFFASILFSLGVIYPAIMSLVWVYLRATGAKVPFSDFMKRI